MTVEATTAFSGPYIPNGATTVFAFSFEAASADEVLVEIDDVEVDSSLYTVALNGGNAGGSVTFGIAPTGSSLMIRSDPDYTQQVDIANAGPFQAEVVESALDRAAVRDIHLKDRVDRLGTLQGDPGGNVMAIGLLAAAIGLSIPIGTDLVQTSGYTVTGKGHALYVADLAVDAAWMAAHPRAGFISANGRGFRLSGEQFLNVFMFGAMGDDPGTGAFGTDDYGAFAAAADFVQAYALTGYVNGTIYRGGWGVRVPKSGYYSSQSLGPLATLKFHGDGGKGWGAPTRIRFAAGVDGLDLQAHNTSGKTTLDGVAHYAGDRIEVRDIAFIGAYSGVESDTHGIRGKRAGDIERCTFDGFEGNGLHCNTTFGSGVGSTEGNTNAMRVINCDFQNNTKGSYREGDDANAISLIACSFINNRQAGEDEDSFLGNHGGFHHYDGNARTADNTGTAAKPASYCSYSGNQYFVIRGQEAGASTNAPSGTTADNTYWGYWQAGGASPTTGVIAWTSGLTWRAGGPILHNGASNSSSWHGLHIESNGVSQVDQGATLQGTLGTVVRVTGGALFRDRANTDIASSEGRVFGGSVAVRGDLRAGSATGNIFGPYRGATVQDGTTTFATRNVSHTIQFAPYDSAGVIGTPWLSVPTGSGFGRSNDFAAGLFDRWKFGGTETAKFDATGLLMFTNKVVGARVTGWTAATGTATRSTFATGSVTLPVLAEHVKALIDDLTTHGLIGT